MRPDVLVRASALCALCLLACVRPAAAEWHLSPMVGLTFSGNTTIVDLEHATGKVHAHFGGAVSLLGGGLFGVESVVMVTPRFFQARGIDLVSSSKALAFMGNVVVTAPRRWTEYSLRPFVSGGFGLLHADATESSAFRLPGGEIFHISENMRAFNIGGGAIGFITKGTGLRFDLRYFGNLHHAGGGAPSIGRVHLRYMTASIGLVFRR